MTDVATTAAAGNPAAPTGQTTTSSGSPAATAPATAPTVAASADTSAHAAMAKALVDGGHWTQEQANAALADAGATGEQPDPQQVAADNAMATALGNQQALADLGATLAADGVETNEAGGVNYLVKQGLQRAPTPEQNAAEALEVLPLLEGMHGKAKAGFVLQWARDEFNRMAAVNPKLRDLAERSGAGNSLAVINGLAARGWQRHVEATIGKRK